MLSSSWSTKAYGVSSPLGEIIYSDGFTIISPVFFLSCKTERAVQVLFSVPHALMTPNKDHLK